MVTISCRCCQVERRFMKRCYITLLVGGGWQCQVFAKTLNKVPYFKVFYHSYFGKSCRDSVVCARSPSFPVSILTFFKSMNPRLQQQGHACAFGRLPYFWFHRKSDSRLQSRYFAKFDRTNCEQSSESRQGTDLEKHISKVKDKTFEC